MTDKKTEKAIVKKEVSDYKIRSTSKGGKIALTVLRWFWLLLFAAYTVVPLIWLFITSLKTNGEYYASRFALPAVPQFVNYVKAWTQANLGHLILNSVTVSLVATVANVLFASMAAYALSRFRFKGKEVIFTLFASGIMVPLNAMMVPYYSVFSKTGLLNSLTSLQILYTAIGIPISVFIIRGFMDSIPVEIEEAAYVDGSGFFGRFFRIILPMSRSGIVTAATFQFVTCWNEFVYANLLISSPEKKTIQIGVRYFTSQFSTDYVAMYAAIIIAIIPSIVIYAIFQEQIIAGMSAGAVKG